MPRADQAPGPATSVVEGHAGNGGAHLTIDELAREVDVSTRNIRSLQARGLLPPPTVHSRTGYYGAEHVARLRLIRELQQEGLTLKGIQRLLDEGHGTGEGLLKVRKAADADTGAEVPEVVSLAELRRQFAVDGDEAVKLLAKAERLGILSHVNEDVYEVPSPALLEAAREAVGMGIGMSAALDAIEVLSTQSRNGAQRFVKLFLSEVWEPFAKAGMPKEQWPAIAEAMKRTRPLAAHAMLAVFQQAMRREVDEALTGIAKRLSEGKR
jgi:DNA-binding transcriptional MerR regulator